MNNSEDFEEIDMDEPNKEPTVSLYQKSKHIKYFSETFSTNSCTIDLNKTKLQTISKFFSEEMPKSSKGCKNFSLDFPERLMSFKQMLENKKKFLKLEKDLKDLQECTFKPKTNLPTGKTSLTLICKKQMDYVKLRNMAKIRTKVAKTPITMNRPAAKVKDPAVHDRLYQDSKIFLRGKLQRTFN
jgi:hypothetical protein